MKWLPQPAAFRDRLTAVRTCADPDARMAQLARLAASQLSYLETLQLDGVFRATEATGLERVRLALLASNTADHLLPSLRVAGLRWGLKVDAYVSGFGQARQALFDRSGELRAFNPDIVLLSLSWREFLGAVPLGASRQDVDSALDRTLGEISALWRAAKSEFGASLVQQSMLDLEPPLFGSFDALAPGAPTRLIALLNTRLADAAADAGVVWLDIARAIARYGAEYWFDVRHWLQAKMEISPNAAPLYGELCARVLAALRGRSRKCLVLDLDDTLWGGVVGDDGVEGIVLGQGTARGEAHLALQLYAKRLRERGVLLAVCSKNEPNVAEAAVSGHPEMALKRGDFSAFYANWNDKGENLKAIARDLNIGLDSLVFVDNNPVERARVREALPMVATPELPEDPALYVQYVADAGYFEAIAFTEEDAKRAENYAAHRAREALRAEGGDLDAFLAGLKMTMVFGPITALQRARAVQLINKTNQFNTNGVRRTESELEALADQTDTLMLQFRLHDRFGDNGVIAVMIARPAEGVAGTFVLENWVMSCRVFGRGVEHEVLNALVESLRQRGVRTLLAEHVRTTKNQLLDRRLPELGFVAAEDSPSKTTWALELPRYVPHKTLIARSESLS